MSHTQNYRGSVAVNALTKHIKKKRIQEKEKGITKMTAVDFERQCDYCGQTYVAHRLTSHYCSKQCCRLAYKVKTRGDKLSKKVVAERKKHVATKIRDLGAKVFLTPSEVAHLLDLSRATIYRYLAEGIIKCKQFKRKTLIRRADIESLFNEECEYKLKHTTRIIQPLAEETRDYYTLREIMGKFNVGRKFVWNRCKKYNVEKKTKGRTDYYNKREIDKYFADLLAEFNPSEYYTIDQMMEKFNMTHDSVIGFAQRHNLPRVKKQNFVYYSKTHVDSIKIENRPLDSLYYTVSEIMEKYGMTRSQARYSIAYYDVERIKNGRHIAVLRTAFDKVYNERIKKNGAVAETIATKPKEDKPSAFEEKVENVPFVSIIETECKPVNEVEYGLIKGYLNAEQISEKYKITREWASYITRKKNVPKIYSCGLYFYEETAVDAICRKYESPEGIEEWYTSDDVERIFNMTGNQRNSFAFKHKIPTKREYGIMFYSKLHMDFAKNPGSKFAGEYYKVEEIIDKYKVDRETVYSVTRYHKIPKVRDGKIVLFLKSVVDKEFSEWIETQKKANDH